MSKKLSRYYLVLAGIGFVAYCIKHDGDCLIAGLILMVLSRLETLGGRK